MLNQLAGFKKLGRFLSQGNELNLKKKLKITQRKIKFEREQLFKFPYKTDEKKSSRPIYESEQPFIFELRTLIPFR